MKKAYFPVAATAMAVAASTFACAANALVFQTSDTFQITEFWVESTGFATNTPDPLSLNKLSEPGAVVNSITIGVVPPASTPYSLFALANATEGANPGGFSASIERNATFGLEFTGLGVTQSTGIISVQSSCTGAQGAGFCVAASPGINNGAAGDPPFSIINVNAADFGLFLGSGTYDMEAFATGAPIINTSNVGINNSSYNGNWSGTVQLIIDYDVVDVVPAPAPLVLVGLGITVLGVSRRRSRRVPDYRD